MKRILLGITLILNVGVGIVSICADEGVGVEQDVIVTEQRLLGDEWFKQKKKDYQEGKYVSFLDLVEEKYQASLVNAKEEEANPIFEENQEIAINEEERAEKMKQYHIKVKELDSQTYDKLLTIANEYPGTFIANVIKAIGSWDLPQYSYEVWPEDDNEFALRMELSRKIFIVQQADSKQEDWIKPWENEWLWVPMVLQSIEKMNQLNMDTSQFEEAASNNFIWVYNFRILWECDLNSTDKEEVKVANIIKEYWDSYQDLNGQY